MAHQISGFALRFVTKINVSQLVALGLALGAVIMGMPGGGGGGTS